MKNKVLRIVFGSLFLKGSLIVLLSSVISNIGSYVYHLAMGRMLGPEDYGILESMFSLIYFLSIPLSVLGIVIVKFVSQYSSEESKLSGFVKNIINKASRYSLYISLMLLIIYPAVNRLIRFDSFLLYFTIILLFYLGIFPQVFSATLQGLLKFKEMGILSIINSWTKVIFAFIFVYFGLKVFGAMFGILVSVIISIILGLIIVRKYVNLKNFKEVRDYDLRKNFGSYSLAVMLSNLSMISLFSTDIILARIFLPPIEAGKYAAISVLGKIIFFASSPIVTVMFPMISERSSKGEKYQKLLLFCILLLILISSLISLVYLLFPTLMIVALYGKQYATVSNGLFYFAVFISIYSLCNLMVIYFLSISRKKVFFFPLTFALLQIILLCNFHQNIIQMVRMNIISASLLFIALLVYYLKYGNKTKLSFGDSAGI